LDTPNVPGNLSRSNWMQWQSNEQDLESDPRRQRFRSGREQFRETG
jgi:hypothetical protein